jgi:biopolymer transport protein ExbD
VATVEPITVAIAADGTITAAGRTVPLQGLHKYFQDLASTHPNTAVNVMPDVNTRYGTVLQVLDAAKTAGLQPRLGAPPPR